MKEENTKQQQQQQQWQWMATTKPNIDELHAQRGTRAAWTSAKQFNTNTSKIEWFTHGHASHHFVKNYLPYSLLFFACPRYVCISHYCRRIIHSKWFWILFITKAKYMTHNPFCFVFLNDTPFAAFCIQIEFSRFFSFSCAKKSLASVRCCRSLTLVCPDPCNTFSIIICAQFHVLQSKNKTQTISI